MLMLQLVVFRTQSGSSGDRSMVLYQDTPPRLGASCSGWIPVNNKESPYASTYDTSGREGALALSCGNVARGPKLGARSPYIPKGMLRVGYETTSHQRHSTPDQQGQR